MFSTFVNFGDIKGESRETNHKDWVAALNVNFQVSKAPTPSLKAAGGPAPGAPAPSEFVITKQLDKANPKLFEALTKGTHIPEVTIDYERTANKAPVKYLEIKLKEVIISAISHNANPAGPTETITLVYKSMEQTHFPETADIAPTLAKRAGS